MKILPALLLCLPLAAHAEWGEFDHAFENEKPWKELSAQLPPYPNGENLVEFNVSSATRNRHFIDIASISIGEDKVVRYTAVIEAAGGARNISFEGMRCETGERRLYAYGQPEGTWSKARNAGWERIKLRSLEGMRCETGERRLYAYGQPEGTWSKARNAGWERIKLRSLLSYHKALYEDHFCPGGINVRDAGVAVRSLQRGGR